MARLDTSGLDDLIAEMERMGQSSGDVAEAMVNAAVSKSGTPGRKPRKSMTYTTPAI